MVSKITDKILPQVKGWQCRPLDHVYPFVFMDCIHHKVRKDGRILNITVGADETSKFWLCMLNDLKNRRVKVYCSSV